MRGTSHTLPFPAEGLFGPGGGELLLRGVVSVLERREFVAALLVGFCLTSMVSATEEEDMRFDVRLVVTPDSMLLDCERMLEFTVHPIVSSASESGKVRQLAKWLASGRGRGDRRMYVQWHPNVSLASESGEAAGKVAGERSWQM